MELPLSSRQFQNHVFPLSWDAALALRDLGIPFLLLITGDDEAGDLLERIVVRFIAHQQLSLYVGRVSVEKYPRAASFLGAALLPQVRLYREGREVGRHRGTASYESLIQLLQAD